MKRSLRLLAVAAIVIILLLVASFIQTSKPSSTPVRLAPTAEETFWKWFVDNRGRLDPVVDGGEGQGIGELCSFVIGPELRKVHPGLCCTIGVAPGIRELVISADSDKAVFQAVLSLTRAHPPIPGWTITAFRPKSPYSEGLRIKLNGQSVGATDLWFQQMGEHDGMKVLSMRVKGLTPGNREERGKAAFVLLEHVIGEYDFATRVRVTGLEGAPDDLSKHLSLKELVESLAKPE